MKEMERNVMRLVAVEQLRAACGIKIKNWNKNKQGSKAVTTQSVSRTNIKQYTFIFSLNK
jgi:hypothetical protein